MRKAWVPPRRFGWHALSRDAKGVVRHPRPSRPAQGVPPCHTTEIGLMEYILVLLAEHSVNVLVSC
jgi:hypothetical protein